jgi:hypothetical protein
MEQSILFMERLWLTWVMATAFNSCAGELIA